MHRPAAHSPDPGPVPPAGEDLLLVAGLPRSGTTWLGKIFDSHPATLYLHEPDKGRNVAGLARHVSRREVEGPGAEGRRASMERGLARILEVRTPAVVAKPPSFPKRYRSGLRAWMHRALGAARALPFGRWEVPDLVDPSRAPSRLVWKSVNSLGRLGALRAIRPRMRTVVIVRHPCGQIASILRGRATGSSHGPLPSEDWDVFAALIEDGCGRAEGVTLESLERLDPLERMAWRWALVLEKAARDAERWETCRWERYEDLCRDPLGRTRALLSFAGLDDDPQTEAFVRASVGDHDDGYFAVRKNPLEAANAWRDELSPDDAARIVAVVERTGVGRWYLSGAAGAPRLARVAAAPA